MDTRLAYGIHAVRKALAAGRVEHVYLQVDLGPRRLGRLADDIARSAVPVTHCAPADLERLTGTAKHQGIAALVVAGGSLTEREARDFVTALETPLLLVLDGIQDPRNFGSLLRTADGAGVDLVVTARNRNVAVTPVVTQGGVWGRGGPTAGGGGQPRPVSRPYCQRRASGSSARTTEPQSSAYSTLISAGRSPLVMGGEGEGLRRLTREHCDLHVRLPMHGVVESLNVAVAAGICLVRVPAPAQPPCAGDGPPVAFRVPSRAGKSPVSL